MKKSAAVLLTLIIALAFTLGFVETPAFVAHAEDAETYIMGTVSDLKNNSAAEASAIPIRNSLGKILFYLPESYYVKVIEPVDLYNSYSIEYAGISNLFISFSETGGKEPETVNFAANVSPYPNLLLQIVDQNQSIELSDTKTPTKKTITAADGYTIKFLGFKGDNKDESIYVTASKNDVNLQGAVSKTAFTAFSLPYHPITEAERQSLITPPTDGDSQPLAPKSSNTLRIILIIGIIVPAVLIVFLLFKPSKDGKNNYDKRAIKHKRADEYDYDRDRRYDAEKNYDRDYDRYDRDYRNDHVSRYDRDYDRRYRDDDYRDGNPPRGYDDRGRYDK